MGVAIIGAAAVVLAALAAFYGVIRGADATKKNEHDKWRHDRLLEGAATYIAVSSERYDRYKVMSKDAMTDDERITLGNKEQHGRALVSLVGSQTVKDRLDELANLVSETRPTSAASHESDVLRALDAFIAEVRLDAALK